MSEKKRSKSADQFSLWSLMALVTVVCMVFALPEGEVLLVAFTVWVSLGALILSVLLLFQAPIYRLLSGTKQVDHPPGLSGTDRQQLD